MKTDPNDTDTQVVMKVQVRDKQPENHMHERTTCPIDKLEFITSIFLIPNRWLTIFQNICVPIVNFYKHLQTLSSALKSCHNCSLFQLLSFLGCSVQKNFAASHHTLFYFFLHTVFLAAPKLPEQLKEANNHNYNQSIQEKKKK